MTVCDDHERLLMHYIISVDCLSVHYVAPPRILLVYRSDGSAIPGGVWLTGRFMGAT